MEQVEQKSQKVQTKLQSQEKLNKLLNPSEHDLNLIVQKFFKNLSEQEKSNKIIWRIYKKAYYHWIDKLLSKEDRVKYNCTKKNFDKILIQYLPEQLVKTPKILKKLRSLYQSRNLGGVIIKDVNSNQFLMVQGPWNNIGFAKGKLKQGQSYLQAGIRQAEQQVQIEKQNLIQPKDLIYFHVETGIQNMYNDSSQEQQDDQSEKQIQALSPAQQQRNLRGKDCIFFYAEVDKNNINQKRIGKQQIDEVVAIHWVDISKGIETIQQQLEKRITMISKDVIYDIYQHSNELRGLRYNKNFPSFTKPIDIQHPVMYPKKILNSKDIKQNNSQRKLYQIVKNSITKSENNKMQIIPTLVLCQSQMLGANNKIIPKLVDIIKDKNNVKNKFFYCSTSRNGKNSICKSASKNNIKSQFIFKEWLEKSPTEKIFKERLQIQDSQLILCQPYSLNELLIKNRLYNLKQNSKIDWKNSILYIDFSNKMHHSDIYKVFEILSSYPPKMIISQFNFKLCQETSKDFINLIKVVYPNLRVEQYQAEAQNIQSAQKIKSQREIKLEKLIENCPKRVIHHYLNFPILYLRGNTTQIGIPRSILQQTIYIIEKTEKQKRVVQNITILFFGVNQNNKFILTPHSDFASYYMNTILHFYDIPRKLNESYGVFPINKSEFHFNEANFINNIIKSAVNRTVNLFIKQRYLKFFQYYSQFKTYISELDYYNQKDKKLYIPIFIDLDDCKLLEDNFSVYNMSQYVNFLHGLVYNQNRKDYETFYQVIKDMMTTNKKIKSFGLRGKQIKYKSKNVSLYKQKNQSNFNIINNQQDKSPQQKTVQENQNCSNQKQINKTVQCINNDNFEEKKEVKQQQLLQKSEKDQKNQSLKNDL